MTVFISGRILVVLGHLDTRFYGAFRVHELVRCVEEKNLLWLFVGEIKYSDLIVDDYLKQALLDLVTFLSILIRHMFIFFAND